MSVRMRAGARVCVCVGGGGGVQDSNNSKRNIQRKDGKEKVSPLPFSVGQFPEGNYPGGNFPDTIFV